MSIREKILMKKIMKKIKKREKTKKELALMKGKQQVVSKLRSAPMEGDDINDDFQEMPRKIIKNGKNHKKKKQHIQVVNSDSESESEEDNDEVDEDESMAQNEQEEQEHENTGEEEPEDHDDDGDNDGDDDGDDYDVGSELSDSEDEEPEVEVKAKKEEKKNKNAKKEEPSFEELDPSAAAKALEQCDNSNRSFASLKGKSSKGTGGGRSKANKEENIEAKRTKLSEADYIIFDVDKSSPSQPPTKKVPVEPPTCSFSIGILPEDNCIQKDMLETMKENSQATKNIYCSIERLYDLKKEELKEIKRHNVVMENLRLKEVEDKIEKNRKLVELKKLKYTI